MVQNEPRTPAVSKGEAAVVGQRVIIGFFLICMVVGLFLVDAWLSGLALADPQAQGLVDWRGLLLHGGLLTLTTAVLVLAATYEALGMAQVAGVKPAVGWAMLISVVLTIHPWVAYHVRGLSPDALGLIILTIALIGSVAAIMLRKQTDGAIQDIASTWLAGVYLGLLASFAVRIRQEVPGGAGAWVVLWFIAVVKFTDIFAYGTGMAVGRHRLIPWLSPGKTWEGLAGGLAGAALISVLLLCASVIIEIGGIRHDIGFGVYLAVGLLGALLGGIGQLGDLMESLLKRGAKQKDSAKLLPGFGGVFDLLDSPLLAAPAAWALVRLFQHLRLIGAAPAY